MTSTFFNKKGKRITINYKKIQTDISRTQSNIKHFLRKIIKNFAEISIVETQLGSEETFKT